MGFLSVFKFVSLINQCSADVNISVSEPEKVKYMNITIHVEKNWSVANV